MSSIRTNPETTRAWQERSRKPLKRTPLAVSDKPLRKTKLRAQSAKRKKQNMEYSRRRAAFLRERPFCARCESMGCRTAATDIHHMAGREGERLIDVSRWVQLCRPCHQWATDNGEAAKAAGWSLSRIGGGAE